MVERLKIAIEKARAARAQAATAGPPAPGIPEGMPQIVQEEQRTGSDPVAANWEALELISLDPRHLEQHRIITQDRSNPAHIEFDVLRTRILRAFQKHGWTRVAITSPDKGCGKTFVSANLALSLSRQQNCRAVLIDLDLRAPNLARVLGVRHPDPVSWFLRGDMPASTYLRRIGHNLALGLNAERVRDAAELLFSPQTTASLDAMRDSLAPDVVIYDMPPMLNRDDVLGFLPQLDCVLLVVGGGQTRPAQVTECERLLADQTHLLGIVLNRADEAGSGGYGYE